MIYDLVIFITDVILQYWTCCSSTNAYMLMYRRTDKQRNVCKFAAFLSASSIIIFVNLFDFLFLLGLVMELQAVLFNSVFYIQDITDM